MEFMKKYKNFFYKNNNQSATLYRNFVQNFIHTKKKGGTECWLKSAMKNKLCNTSTSMNFEFNSKQMHTQLKETFLEYFIIHPIFIISFTGENL